MEAAPVVFAEDELGQRFDRCLTDTVLKFGEFKHSCKSRFGKKFHLPPFKGY